MSSNAVASEFGPGTKLLTEIEFTLSDAEQPPNHAEWQAATLPMIRSAPHFSDIEDQEVVWFRIPLKSLVVNQDRLQSLYIWRHNLKLSVFSQGVFLGGTEGSDEKGIGWNHPLLLDLPLTATQADSGDYVMLRVVGGPGGVMLSPLVSGNREELQEAFNHRYLVQIQSAIWCFVLCLLLAALSFWLWTQRRQEKLYLHFSAMTLLSAVTLSFFFLDTIPLTLHIWLVVQHIATDWITYFMLSYTALALANPYSENKWQTARTSVLAACIVMTLVYPLLPAFYLQPVAYSVHGLLSLLMFGVGLQVLYATYRQPNGTHIWFSVAFCGFLIVNLHDFAAVFLSSPEEYIKASNWLHLTPPLMAVAFFGHLVYRFVTALEVSEQLNRDLEARVAASRQALEASYAEQREMELKHTADAERQKIYRELHDDLGSKLVSIVHSAEGSKQSELARSALESLRESIYTARHNQQTLNQCLEAISTETALRIEGAGVTFNQKIEVFPSFNIAPQIAYNLTRILREGVSNLLQHSQTESAQLVVEFHEPMIVISLIDQGIGRVKAFFANGGLSNIQYRAERIGAGVEWIPGEPGCRLVITLTTDQLTT